MLVYSKGVTMRRGTWKERRLGIESGVNNAVDTVFIDKEMSLQSVKEQLESFVSDGLNCHGLNDIVTKRDMRYAREIFPL